MNYPACPACHQNSMIEVEKLSGGFSIVACLYCDLPQDEDRWAIYKNHCWNCGFGIDSRFSIQSKIPGMGYHCGSCGKDLTEFKLRRGSITAAQLLQLGGNNVTLLRPLCDQVGARCSIPENEQR